MGFFENTKKEETNPDDSSWNLVLVAAVIGIGVASVGGIAVFKVFVADKEDSNWQQSRQVAEYPEVEQAAEQPEVEQVAGRGRHGGALHAGKGKMRRNVLKGETKRRLRQRETDASSAFAIAASSVSSSAASSKASSSNASSIGSAATGSSTSFAKNMSDIIRAFPAGTAEEASHQTLADPNQITAHVNGSGSALYARKGKLLRRDPAQGSHRKLFFLRAIIFFFWFF